MNVIKDVIFEGTLLKMIFVKEFGEGVNHMCNELEQIGLKDSVYHTNAFMLQAVIYNSNVEKISVEEIIVEKTADLLKKLAVAPNKSLFDTKKSAIEQQKYHEPSKTNILKVYNEIEKNQIFGTKEIEEILACSPSTARAVMAKLRDMGVVIAVKERENTYLKNKQNTIEKQMKFPKMHKNIDKQ